MPQPANASSMTTNLPSRRQALLASGALIAGMLGPGRAHCEQPRRATPTGTDWQPEDWLPGPADAVYPEADSLSWDPFGQLVMGNQTLQSITLVPASPQELRIGQDPKSPINQDFPPFRQVYCEEADPMLMKYVSRTLGLFPLCFGIARDVKAGPGGFGGRPLAVLRMRTFDSTFWISVTRSGFARGVYGANSDTLFYSATLTRTLELIYKKATGEPLPQYFVERLSGEDHIRQQFAGFDRWQASQK